MNKKYSKDLKKQIIEQRQNKKTVLLISSETGIPRSTIYRWLNEARNSTHPNAKNKEIQRTAMV